MSTDPQAAPKAYVDSLDEIGQLKQAIDTNDLARVKNLMVTQWDDRG